LRNPHERYKKHDFRPGEYVKIICYCCKSTPRSRFFCAKIIAIDRGIAKVDYLNKLLITELKRIDKTWWFLKKISCQEILRLTDEEIIEAYNMDIADNETNKKC